MDQMDKAFQALIIRDLHMLVPLMEASKSCSPDFKSLLNDSPFELPSVVFHGLLWSSMVFHPPVPALSSSISCLWGLHQPHGQLLAPSFVACGSAIDWKIHGDSGVCLWLYHQY